MQHVGEGPKKAAGWDDHRDRAAVLFTGHAIPRIGVHKGKRRSDSGTISSEVAGGLQAPHTARRILSKARSAPPDASALSRAAAGSKSAFPAPASGGPTELAFIRDFKWLFASFFNHKILQ